MQKRIPNNKFTFERVTQEFLSYGVKVLEEEKNYRDISTPISLECPNCKQSFQYSLFRFRSKQNKTCESCSRKAPRKQLTFNDIKKTANDLGSNLLDLSNDPYILKASGTFVCNRCSCTYQKLINRFLNDAKKSRANCPSCGIKERNQIQKEKSLKKFEEFSRNNNINLLHARNSKSLFLCPSCGDSFERGNKYLNKESYPNRTNLCAKCSNGRPSSSQEERVVAELKKYTVVETNRRDLIKPYEIDIYLPEYRIGIEINGLYHHSQISGGKSKDYHLTKKVMAESADIFLFQFWDIEVNEKFDLLISMILSKMNIFQKKYFARKLQKKPLSSQNARDFFESNHMDGFVGGEHWGLYEGSECICAISFGQGRYDKAATEILRFATKKNSQVLGGFSRLVGDRKNCISYANRRWSNGGVYNKSGWEVESLSEPSYWYFKGKKLFHRSSFQKHKLKNILQDFDENHSEWQNMMNAGWDRVYDCGTIKFRKTS
jgi:hypothetical protein